MFGMGWSEMMVVGIVALIVIGPKDLPGLFQQLGQFAGKARGMAREFTNAMNDAARDSGVGDIQKTLNAVANPKKFGLGKIHEATSGATADLGPATTALSEERAASKAKFEQAAADMVTQRKATADKGAAAAKPAAKPVAKPVANLNRQGMWSVESSDSGSDSNSKNNNSWLTELLAAKQKKRRVSVRKHTTIY